MVHCGVSDRCIVGIVRFVYCQCSIHHRAHMTASWHGSAFHKTGPLCGESFGDRWFPLRWPMDSPHLGPVIHTFGSFFVVRLNNLLNELSSCQWFEMIQRSCDVSVMRIQPFAVIYDDLSPCYNAVWLNENVFEIISVWLKGLFTHWGRVTHAILTIINSWTAPSHYLNQCWNIVNWSLGNKLQWNFSRNSNIFIKENAF